MNITPFDLLLENVTDKFYNYVIAEEMYKSEEYSSSIIKYIKDKKEYKNLLYDVKVELVKFVNNYDYIINDLIYNIDTVNKILLYLKNTNKKDLLYTYTKITIKYFKDAIQDISKKDINFLYMLFTNVDSLSDIITKSQYPDYIPLELENTIINTTYALLDICKNPSIYSNWLKNNSKKISSGYFNRKYKHVFEKISIESYTTANISRSIR